MEVEGKREQRKNKKVRKTKERETVEIEKELEGREKREWIEEMRKN